MESTFDSNQPKRGAETLLKWAKSAVKSRGGVALPLELNHESVDEFLENLGLVDEQMAAALRFGFATAAPDHNWPPPKPMVYPDYRQSSLIALIALGLTRAPGTWRWLEESPPQEPQLLRELFSQLLEVRDLATADALLGFLTRNAVDAELLDYFAGRIAAVVLPFCRMDEIDAFADHHELPAQALEAARFESCIAAGELEQAEAILERNAPAERDKRFDFDVGRLQTALIENGRGTDAARVLERYGGSFKYTADEEKRCLQLLFDENSPDEAVAIARRLPPCCDGAQHSGLAAHLVRRGAPDEAEKLLDLIHESDVSAVLLAMAQAAREMPELEERAKSWLVRAETALDDVTDREFDRLEIERPLRVEQWRQGNREPFERFAEELRVQPRDLVWPPFHESLAWAETGQLERWLETLDRIDLREDLGQVSSAYFKVWSAETDYPKLLELTRKFDEYTQKQLLGALSWHFADVGDIDRAQDIAEQIRERFAADDGFEAAADAFRRQGNYDLARQFGGAPSYRNYYGLRERPKRFVIGEDDELARDWITSVKDWRRDPEWLLLYGAHGRAKEALEAILHILVRDRLPKWLTEERAESEPDLLHPQDFDGICRRAKEEAKYRIWKDGQGPAPRTPFGITFAIWKLEIMSWLLDRFAGTNIAGAEKRIERETQQVHAARQRGFSAALPKALATPPGRARFEALCKRGNCAEDIENFTPPSALTNALRGEMNWVRAKSSNVRDWEDLAVAMLRAGDASGSAEAWSEYAKSRTIDAHRIQELAEKTRREDWVAVAPLCRNHPLAAAILAAKLARWYPEAGIRIAGRA
ncbi:MAG: hypothetical protein AAF585_07735 [Verrucomicrobiota bacterium]